MLQASKRCIFTSSIKHAMSAKLFVEPVITPVTEPVSIWGAGFKANAPITIKASMNCLSEKLSFSSHAHFTTSENGSFSLLDTKSTGGSYVGTHGMGLFWSMVHGVGSYNLIQVVNACTQLEYDFNVYSGHISEFSDSPLSSARVNRYFAGPTVTRIPVKTGSIHGTLFIPEGNGPFPSIITLYGGNKRRQVVEDAAGILSNHGFVTLALAYFGVDGLNKSYAQEPIRIEFFEEAIHYLMNHEKVNPDAIGVYGISKGGDIALSMASYLSQVKAVACINGSISSIGTKTTFGNKSTEMLPASFDKVSYLPDQTLNIKNALNNPRDHPDSIHNFQDSKADILMIAGLDDYNWDSELFVDIAKERMDHVGKTNYELHKYPGLGHFIDAPFMPPCVKFTHSLVPKGMFVYFGGKNTMQHSIHQENVWKKVISFFFRVFKEKKSKL